MTTNIQMLAIARTDKEKAKQIMKEMTERLQQSDEWANMQTVLNFADAAIETLEAELKEKAIDRFHETGEKKQDYVTVKGFAVVSITDTHKAKDWCMNNFRPALVLDEKTFKTAAREGHIPAELFTVATELRAQIDADLSKWLTQAEIEQLD